MSQEVQVWDVMSGNEGHGEESYELKHIVSINDE